MLSLAVWGNACQTPVLYTHNHPASLRDMAEGLRGGLWDCGWGGLWGCGWWCKGAHKVISKQLLSMKCSKVVYQLQKGECGGTWQRCIKDDKIKVTIQDLGKNTKNGQEVRFKHSSYISTFFIEPKSEFLRGCSIQTLIIYFLMLSIQKKSWKISTLVNTRIKSEEREQQGEEN